MLVALLPVAMLRGGTESRTIGRMGRATLKPLVERNLCQLLGRGYPLFTVKNRVLEVDGKGVCGRENDEG